MIQSHSRVRKEMLRHSERQNPFKKTVIEQAIKDFETNPFNPEVNAIFWRAFLQESGKRAGLNLSVPDCNWTEKEIRRPMKDKEKKDISPMMVYIPEELAGNKGLVKLGQMFPEMGSRDVREGTAIKDKFDVNKKNTWVKIEAEIDSPNIDTTCGDLEYHARIKEYFFQTLNTFILASQAFKVCKGQYLDEGQTWSRLLGSHDGDNEIYASFDPAGRLFVYRYSRSYNRYSDVGGRFATIKRS